MSKKPINGRGVDNQLFRDKHAEPGQVKVTRFYKGEEVKAPERHRCKKCGGPIRFRMLDNGKWTPISVDGGDHWDECREWQAQGTYGIMNLNKRINKIGPVWTIGHNTKNHLKKIGPLHTGPEVPWD